MASKKSTRRQSFESLYKKLEEVILANFGENEYEEIFGLVVLKLWDEINHEKHEPTIELANKDLLKIYCLTSYNHVASY